MATVTTDKEPELFRTGISRGLSNTRPVERDGGDYESGIIRGASIITRGEAAGHKQWVDQFMVSQAVDAVNAAGNEGLKVRFAHPSISSDGLGKLTARAKDGRVSPDGNKGFVDLHIVRSSRKTPDGDLGSYVMDLAENDGDMFGMSIVFDHDTDSEEQFMQENEEFRATFQSPDEQNIDNLRHARIEKVIAADVVDEPAANPDGLFHRESSDIAKQATEMLEYCLGDRKQATNFNGINAERAKQFFNRFLDNHDLEVIQKMAKAETPTENPVDQPDKVDKFADRKTQGAIYIEEFGAELGPNYFCNGLTLDEARAEFNEHRFKEKEQAIEQLQKQVKTLTEENDGLKSQLSAAKAAAAGEEEAFNAGDEIPEPKNGSKKLFANVR